MPATTKPKHTRRSANKAGEDLLTETPRKKNHRLHQSKIDRAMEILGTRTETEAIEQALDLVALRDRLADGVRNMRGADLMDIFEDER
ncbi:MAG TPA: hypothetical protein VK358_13020 [Longimicrobium sp.]|nr:hypothetical protein [Longimicrobium sp.]